LPVDAGGTTEKGKVTKPGAAGGAAMFTSKATDKEKAEMREKEGMGGMYYWS